ncbi:MAG: polysulfide reductase NrfD [Myxococcales bacterium]|nr:polysulfide reductase NrfD [Myxococcales bacterium]MDD9968714.1 polysulfide reductase NrfD [Myxococcales bacterium]
MSMHMEQTVQPPVDHSVSYPKFLWRALRAATDGGPLFYGSMTILTIVALLGANAWAKQVVHGMAVTDMTDHVSWGLYVANFTFLVGLAAGGVMMVIPAYLYRDDDMHDVVIVGELLAVAAIIMAMLSIVVDMGRPDRLWHLIPGIGRMHWPISMLTWDVIVLNGYLLLNLHVCGYLIYTRWLGRTPNPSWYVPFVFMSIFWAFSIHTVTAFLYCGLGGRPFWNSALLAPRFLASAFVTGPAFIVITLKALRARSAFQIPEGAIERLLSIVRITALINLFMAASEVFVEFYTGGSHTASARYLYFGLHGHEELVPWIWTALGLNAAAAVVLLSKPLYRRPGVLVAALVMTFVGVWIEKGMGLIVPAFIPSTLHEIVPYVPSATEWIVTAGIWAFGMMIYIVALKIGLQAMSGRLVRSDLPPAVGAVPQEAE